MPRRALAAIVSVLAGVAMTFGVAMESNAPSAPVTAMVVPARAPLAAAFDSKQRHRQRTDALRAAGAIKDATERRAAAAARADRAKARAKAKALKARKARKAAQVRKAHRWVMPVSHYRLTSGFGMRHGKMHPAQDFAVPIGTHVHAISSGRVIFAGWSNLGYGYLVKIKHWNGTVSWYAHNSRLLVRRGAHVVPGQTISYSGSTGNSTGPHVHFEVHPHGGAAVNPLSWLRKRV